MSTQPTKPAWKQEVNQRLAAHKNRRGAGVIPNSFRIHYGDGTVRADAQAIGFGAIDQRFGANKL